MLAAVKLQPFEPIRLASLKHLTWKTVFFLGITSAHSASELHALRYKEPYLAMSATGVALYPNIDFLPTVSSQLHVTQSIEMPAMHGEVEPGLCLLCVRRALKFYLLQTASFCGDNIQLFLAYSGATRGKPISKQRISKWLVDIITCAYAAHDVDSQHGIKSNHTLLRWLQLIPSSFARLLHGPH